MLEIALIYLAAAIVAVPIAKRVGLGSVLGYLIAGILIGPYALGVVGDQTDVMHFAEFGVVMMLFLVGLELQPSRLWTLRHSILGLGGLQVVLSAAAIFAFCYWFFAMHWQTALAIGLMLALSSTAIVLQSLEEKGWLKREAGQNAKITAAVSTTCRPPSPKIEWRSFHKREGCSSRPTKNSIITTPNSAKCITSV